VSARRDANRIALATSAVASLVGGACASHTTAAPVEVRANASEPYPHASEPIGSVRQSYDGALSPELAVNTFRNIDRLFPTRLIPRSRRPLPLPVDRTPLAMISFTDKGKSLTLDDFTSQNRISGLLVLKDGRIRMERYLLGNSEKTRWMSMSIAKSVTSTLIGAALKEGHIRSLGDSVTRYVPSLRGSAYDGVTVRDVLMMASGARWNETYTNPASDRRRLLEAQISQVPGSALEVMKSLQRAAEPGMVNRYSTGETQVAAEMLKGAIKRPLAEYLAERIWNRVGMEADAKWWIDSPNGTEIGGSGISATLRDYGRFGLFMMNDGVVGRDSILPSGWVREATTPKVLKDGKALEYGYLWWTAETDAARRDGAYVGEGIHGQWLYVNPARRVVIVIWSAQVRPGGGAPIDVWSFFDAVAETLGR
jgi:CubicO group peptidase (beta-lactamase class C family)